MDLEEQMKVFHQAGDELPSEDEDDDDENLIAQQEDNMRVRNQHKKQKTLPGKGNEAVDVNHAQATESSEDDNDDLVQQSSDGGSSDDDDDDDEDVQEGAEGVEYGVVGQQTYVTPRHHNRWYDRAGGIQDNWYRPEHDYNDQTTYNFPNYKNTDKR